MNKIIVVKKVVQPEWKYCVVFQEKKKKIHRKKEILKPGYPHFHVCILVIKLFSLKSY